MKKKHELEGHLGITTYCSCWMLLLFQLRLAQDKETKEKVEVAAILSMADKEIEEALEIVCNFYYVSPCNGGL